MWLDLLYRILELLLAAVISVLGACTLLEASPAQTAAVDQQTTAHQTTVQAAPGSTAIVAGSASAPAADP